MTVIYIADIILIISSAILLSSCQTFKQEPLPLGEQEIAFSQTVGNFNNAGDKVAAVLLLHGFASSKDEVAGLYKRLSDELLSVEISSLIIDGAEDTLVSSLKTYGDLAPDRTTTFAIANADHIYKVFSDDPEPSNQLIEKTVKWYTENLK
ncbi:MAG: hypothetical protein B6241_09740 [Spirochaetaceae bacterium 4572_59]|nr:MAG: hypothetical protein B6241_09740 [Spirochaetaceae bacterium 4572_59]